MISIVIPTYNEAGNIASLIRYLRKHSGHGIEVIVSDGGSNDDTLDKTKQAGAIALLSPVKGRAAQMNYGASFAKGDILYFIHADTLPPESFVSDIYDAVEQKFDFGRYRTKFNNNRSILKFNAFFTRFDWFVCYGGDQTLFITKKLFSKLGGFANGMLIMEDYDIVTRAKQLGRYKIFTKAALISARKYETNSWFNVQHANRTMVSMYKKRATQQDMIQTYKKLIDYR